MKIQNVKGCLDYLPEEQRVRNYINDCLKETFITYGFSSIETPILSYFEMLSGKYDENNDILKEIYKLSDQGKRILGLRYDLTVPFAKFIALNKNNISMPFKRYEIAKVFRDGPVKLGRDREFTQCDADVVGISGQMIEAEMLSLYVEAFKKLGIEIEIQYNSRNLMVGLIKASGVSEELVSSTVTIIDKMNKLRRDEFVSELERIGLNKENIDNLLEYFKFNLNELNSKFINTNIEELKLGLEELSNLNEYIKELKLDDVCLFTPTLARGQDYYTGNVFEVYEKDRKLNCSIGGGGRYDKMITDFIEDGNVYPAVGISFGLTSIYELMMMKEDKNTNSDIDLYIVPMSDSEKAISLRLANELRSKGLKVILEMNNKRIKKCFEWANKRGIPYVTVIGETEVESKEFKIKNMITGDNIQYSFDDVDEIIKELK